MHIKTFGAEYDLVEFNFYIDHENNSASVLDVVVETDDVDLIAQELSNLFVIEAENTHYVFSNYKPIEYYEVGGGLVRVICVK